MTTHRFMAFAIAALVVCFTASVNFAHASLMASVGPGTSIPHNSMDGTPGRTNVDLSNSVLLPAGVYTATFFNYDLRVESDVQPFLASANGVHSYLVLAAGDVRYLPPGVSENQTVAFGGSGTFTLGAATTVYAGITSSDLNPIPFQGSVGLTDHDQSGSQVFVGQTIANFDAPDNARRYSFSITVVPEPSSIVLATTGIAGLLAWSRPRRRCY